MKLSLRKRFGWVHVRGGRLLRVIHAHPVETNSQTLNAVERRRPFRGKSVTAEPGDLAIEIVAVKTGKVLGYSYFAGAALQLNSYDVRPDRFEEIRSHVLTIPDPGPEHKTDRDLGEARLRAFINAKYSPDSVCAFDYTTKFPVHSVAKTMSQYWSYIPEDENAPESQTHLLGIVRAAKGKEVVILHFQPPMHADDYAATGFQTELVLSAIK